MRGEPSIPLSASTRRTTASVAVGPYDDIYPAEHGESVEDNWVFYLSVPNLCDHLFWAVVPKEGGGEIYNYGFN